MGSADRHIADECCHEQSATECSETGCTVSCEVVRPDSIVVIDAIIHYLFDKVYKAFFAFPDDANRNISLTWRMQFQRDPGRRCSDQSSCSVLCFPV